MAKVGDMLPCVEFAAEAESCPVCGGELVVQKSKSRQVITFRAGAFTAREIRKRCRQDASHPVMISESLARLVKPQQRYGYDLIVHVGLARYVRGQQRQEIRAELSLERNIDLSEGTVSALCDRFLRYLEAVHLKSVPALREALAGGYPLHLDATCEHGKGGLFVCMDGWRGWVLMAARIPSEGEAYLRPVVEKTAELFGDPLATVRDMGEGGAKAVAPLRARGVPDLVCHYHFLAAAGKKLFEQPYRLLTNLMDRTKVQSDLRALLRALRQYRKDNTVCNRFGSGSIREELPALVLWLLEGEGKKTLLYPFCLPRLEFYQRCQQLDQKINVWLPDSITASERRVIKQLTRLVNRFECDVRFNTAVMRLQKGWRTFCELRDVLQLTNGELPNGDDDGHKLSVPALEAKRLEKIAEAANQYQETIRERMANTAQENTTDIFHPEGVILKYFDTYGKHLFGQPALRDEDGTIQAVVERTNNVPEHFFGAEKRKLRRRVGRAHLGRDLEDQPAQAALAANLQHPDYVRVLCGSLENLATVFASLSEHDLGQATELSRTNRDTELFRCIRSLVKKEATSDATTQKAEVENAAVSDAATAF